MIVLHHVLRGHVTVGEVVADGKKHGVVNKANGSFMFVEGYFNE